MKKATNISFAGIILIYAAAMLLALSSCTPVKVVQSETIIKDSIVYKDSTVYVHVPPIVIPGDTVELVTLIPCADTVKLSATSISKTGRTTVTAEISKGVLKVDCKTDSLLKEIDSLKAQVKIKEQYQIKETIRYVPIKEGYIPWWVWILAGVAVLLIAVFGIKLLK